MQFVQKKLTKIVVKLVVDKKRFSQIDKKKIQEELIYRFGNEMEFDIQIVEEIEREKSGKYSLIKNILQEGR